MQKAIKLINDFRKTPKMYASSKESYLNIIITVLQMVSPDVNIDFNKEFWKTFLTLNGNIYTDAHKDFDVDWAHSVCDKALNILNYKKI